MPAPRPTAFVIRVHRDGAGLRGRIIAVESGAQRMFAALEEAIEFIRTEISELGGGTQSGEGPGTDDEVNGGETQ